MLFQATTSHRPRKALVRVATFNINNVVRRLPNLLAWLAAEAPDVVCLQELKCPHDGFPVLPLREAGYEAVWRGEGRWNGVAILARGRAPVLTRAALPGDNGDVQARYIEAAVGGVLIASIYLPNGNPQPGPKFDYKLAWFDRLIDHAAALKATGAPVVLAGDYNVVPTDADIYNTRSWLKNALLQPQPRAQFQRLLDQGWTDALAGVGRPWTFWQYFREAWPRDAGLRLDHILTNLTIASAGVDRWVRGAPDASDHAPAWVEI